MPPTSTPLLYDYVGCSRIEPRVNDAAVSAATPAGLSAVDATHVAVAAASSGAGTAADTGVRDAGDGGTGLSAWDGAVHSGACNAVQQAGAPISAELGRGTAPTAGTGGAIADGTYVLRSWRIYGTSADDLPLRPVRLTLVLRGGTYERVHDDEYDGTLRESGTFNVDRSSWTQRATCSNEPGIAVEGRFTYTASPGALTWQASEGTMTVDGVSRPIFVEEVFAKR
jgi:hypothetical protein